MDFFLFFVICTILFLSSLVTSSSSTLFHPYRQSTDKKSCSSQPHSSFFAFVFASREEIKRRIKRRVESERKEAREEGPDWWQAGMEDRPEKNEGNVARMKGGMEGWKEEGTSTHIPLAFHRVFFFSSFFSFSLCLLYFFDVSFLRFYYLLLGIFSCFIFAIPLPHSLLVCLPTDQPHGS